MKRLKLSQSFETSGNDRLDFMLITHIKVKPLQSSFPSRSTTSRSNMLEDSWHLFAPVCENWQAPPLRQRPPPQLLPQCCAPALL